MTGDNHTPDRRGTRDARESLAHYLEAAGFSDVEGRIAGMTDEQVREMHRSVIQDGECTEGDSSPTP